MTVIRKLEKRDSEAYLSMAAEFYSGPGVLHEVDPGVFERNLAEVLSDSPFLEGFVFETEGMVVGYALITHSFASEVGGRSVFIEEIFVDPQYRGQGIGRQFLDYCVSLMGGEIRRVRLEVTPANEKATALYRSCGFEELDYMQMVIDRP